jgi:hypothetical protein
MLEIGRTILSLDVIKAFFCCDLAHCKGACCIEGDSGAPLTKQEATIITRIYPLVSPYLPPEHNEIIKNHGSSFIDNDGDLVTSLVRNQECVFSYRDENGILKCSFESAYLDGITTFRKPISCHLFPIRITEYKRFDAVNYEQLPVCIPGRICGKSRKIPLYRYLKEPLIRKYGVAWYQKLELAARHLNEKENV